MNTPKRETNLQHLLVVGIDMFILDVLLPHSIGLPDLPVEVRPRILNV